MLGDPVEHLVEPELLEAERVLRAGLDLVPRHRRGDERAARGRAGSTARSWSSSRRSATSPGRPCPDRLAFVIVAVTSCGCSPWSSSATSLASAVESSDGSRPGRSAYRCRPLLPLVTGRASRPRSASLSRTSSATRQHSCSPAGSPGSRSMTSRSALRGPPVAPDRPLVDVQLQRAPAAEGAESAAQMKDCWNDETNRGQRERDARSCVAAVRLKRCSLYLVPPNRMERPSTSSTLPMIDPVREAFTTLVETFGKSDAGDDQLRGVSESGIEQCPQTLSHAGGERFGGASDPARDRNDAESGTNEERSGTDAPGPEAQKQSPAERR